MCQIGDLDPSEVWCEVLRRARLPHRCSCCGSVITVGEQYLSHFSVFEGDAASEKMCAACKVARDAFCEAHSWNGCTPSYFPTVLAECVDDRTVIVEDSDEEIRWRPMLEAIRERSRIAKGMESR